VELPVARDQRLAQRGVHERTASTPGSD
jgi:hypothetical protein